ncbi:MAG: hypothetical protein KGJ37_00270 [Verrucomicrobiota bacterium]|nr:hypothetical protein [Verrucomicrobiota bacterium]
MLNFEKLEVWQKSIAREQNFLSASNYEKTYADAIEIVRMLSGLKNSFEG